MTELAHIFALLQEGSQAAEASQGIFSTIGEFLRQCGLGTGELTAGSAAVALAVLWVFARVIRTVVSVLFALCVLLLVLQLTGYMDTTVVWETLGQWFRSATAETPAP